MVTDMEVFKAGKNNEQPAAKMTGIAVLDENNVRCTEEGLDNVKRQIDERYPEEKGRPVMAVMGETANDPDTLRAMIRSGDLRYAVIRNGEKVCIMGPDYMADLARVLGGVVEGATSWDVAITGIDWKDGDK